MVEIFVPRPLSPRPRPRKVFRAAPYTAERAEADSGATFAALTAAMSSSLGRANSRNARHPARSVALTSSRKAATAAPFLPYLLATCNLSRHSNPTAGLMLPSEGSANPHEPG